MNTKKIVLLSILSLAVVSGVLVYVFLFQNSDENIIENTNISDDSYVDPMENNIDLTDQIKSDITFENGLYNSPDLSAQIPESWVLYNNVDNEVLAATNVEETIQLTIMKYSYNLDEYATPEDSIKFIFDDASSETSSHLNFTVLQEPSPFQFKNYVAAQGVSNSDVMIDDNESINITGRLIYIVTDTNQYQIIFDVKSAEFEKETEIFNQFLESLEVF